MQIDCTRAHSRSSKPVDDDEAIRVFREEDRGTREIDRSRKV